jgi:hypothetical protein
MRSLSSPPTYDKLKEKKKKEGRRTFYFSHNRHCYDSHNNPALKSVSFFFIHSQSDSQIPSPRIASPR